MVRRQRRARGNIEPLPSGGFRVRVYAGRDPVTGRDYYLRESVPPGPKAEAQAERVRTRLANEVYERRNPRTDATVAQLVERHLREADLADDTLDTYTGYVKKHVVPLLGRIKIGSLGADTFDSFYAELRRCRDHCRKERDRVDHRTPLKHACDDRCGPHQCRPLAASTVRQIHFILSGALRRAVRLGWLATNPIDVAEPPAPPKSNPRPPTPEQAARIINEAWRDPDWGTLIWLTMIVGHRRGELCGIRWRNLDLKSGVLHLEKSIAQRGRRKWEKDTKSHQDRRVVLGADTVELLNEHYARCVARAAALGLKLSDDAFVFSLAPDAASHLLPDSVGQRYSKLAKRLGIDTSLHKLRHYSATELVAAGVNIRTVAGRLGHGGGGTTTLRTYTAWVSEADQRAAKELVGRMPSRPQAATLPPMIEFTPTSPFETIAVAIRDGIYDGRHPIGLPIPSVKALARTHGVSASTAQRAVKLLDEWGLVSVTSGRPTIVQPRGNGSDLIDKARVTEEPSVGARPLDLEVRQLGSTIAALTTQADPSDTAVLHRHLVGAVKRAGQEIATIEDFELVVRQAGDDTVLRTYVVLSA